MFSIGFKSGLHFMHVFYFYITVRYKNTHKMLVSVQCVFSLEKYKEPYDRKLIVRKN